MDKELLRSNLEALLFVSEEPQNLRRLTEAIPRCKSEEVQEVLDEMILEYSAQQFGIQITEIAGEVIPSSKFIPVSNGRSCFSSHFPFTSSLYFFLTWNFG